MYSEEIDVDVICSNIKGDKDNNKEEKNIFSGSLKMDTIKTAQIAVDFWRKSSLKSVSVPTSFAKKDELFKKWSLLKDFNDSINYLNKKNGESEKNENENRIENLESKMNSSKNKDKTKFKKLNILTMEEIREKGNVWEDMSNQIIYDVGEEKEHMEAMGWCTDEDKNEVNTVKKHVINGEKNKKLSVIEDVDNEAQMLSLSSFCDNEIQGATHSCTKENSQKESLKSNLMIQNSNEEFGTKFEQFPYFSNLFNNSEELNNNKIHISSRDNDIISLKSDLMSLCSLENGEGLFSPKEEDGYYEEKTSILPELDLNFEYLYINNKNDIEELVEDDEKGKNNESNENGENEIDNDEVYETVEEIVDEESCDEDVDIKGNNNNNNIIIQNPFSKIYVDERERGEEEQIF
jgi:hypothetical protein